SRIRSTGASLKRDPMDLRPCTTCSRHVRVGTLRPFCGSGTQRAAPRAARLPLRWAAAGVSAALAASCVAEYGAPAPPCDDNCYPDGGADGSTGGAGGSGGTGEGEGGESADGGANGS